jgi:D-alanyl-lipoteichoic acid acyltransferase DltB (MBOAT superfamily)
MPFTSGAFLLFIAVFLPLYFALERRMSARQIHAFTALSSTLFVAYYFPPLALLPIIQAVICWVFVQRPRGRRALALAVFATLSPLLYFKYFTFFLSWFAVPHSSPALPLGISFYTFTAIGLLVDHHRRDDELTRISFGDALNFLTFWPHLASGPILRTRSFLLPKLVAFRDRDFNLAIALLVFGLYKKVFLADGVGGYVDQNLTLGIDGMGTAAALCTMLGMAVRIYGDFSGYSDMAIGFALLLGVRLPANFNYPYVARSLTDFWRRWHISLSTWFRDYVYIPLGGSRHGLPRALVAILITFVLSGVWHGAAWNFLAWGALHGLGLMVERVLRPKLQLPAWLGVLLTFLFGMVAWSVFFLSVDDAAALMGAVFHTAEHPEIYNSSVIAFFFVFVLLDILFPPYTVDDEGYPQLTRFALALTPVAVFLMWVFAGKQLPFIYFEF